MNKYTRCFGHAFNCYDPFYLLGEADDAMHRHDASVYGRWARRELLSSSQSKAPHGRLNLTEVEIW